MAKNKQGSPTGSEAAPTDQDQRSALNKSHMDDDGPPIVGIGASAGGLEALRTFFDAVPKDSGLAFVVVVHMSAKHPSMLCELLQRVAAIPVTTAADGEAILANHAYVVPPDREIGVFQSKIQLLEEIKIGVSHPIDAFFRSLAEDRTTSAAAVVLSGTGTDGTLGVKEIKAREGLVIVQSEESAAYDGMPRSAISTGLVDAVLPVEAIPNRLMEFFTQFDRIVRSGVIVHGEQDRSQWLSKVFAILRTQVGHDFSAYKTNTILRRIGRRMTLNQIEAPEDYVRFMRENRSEVDSLFRDLLIGVTSFFRDRESFDALQGGVLAETLDRMKTGDTFRAWIPGCSTGEEVYSLAMLLREILDGRGAGIGLQLFGTDIDDRAIERARDGVFPSNVVADVGSDRLSRFFSKVDDQYRVSKEIRDCVVFSVQDLLRDPPFSRLHLVCCRNVLIYLDSKAQKKLLPLFHYTLLPRGILLLGTSETVGGFSNLFKPVDRKWKIYSRLEVLPVNRQMVEFPSGPSVAGSNRSTSRESTDSHPLSVPQLLESAVLDHFAPTAILVDNQSRVLNVRGRTAKYLETPSGSPTNIITDLAREGLRIELSSALREAKNSNKRVLRRNVLVGTEGNSQLIHLHVIPYELPHESGYWYLVAFEDLEAVPSALSNDTGAEGLETEDISDRINELERELLAFRESYQTTVEELESSNEELKSTNEELQSANEELQSTNEELESSKEELQSLNEELQTVNAELNSKVDELFAVHDDMRNLLNSTEIATIFVDRSLRIRRFTQEATKIVNLIEADKGRPLAHVVTNLGDDDLLPDLQGVLDELIPLEREVRTTNGLWYNMRIIPYRTADNRIDGAVLTFAAIETQKTTQRELTDAADTMEEAWELVRSVFDLEAIPVAVLGPDSKIEIVNKSLSTALGVVQGEVRGLEFASILTEGSAKRELVSSINHALSTGEGFQFGSIEVGAKGRFKLVGSTFRVNQEEKYRILLKMEPVG